MSFKVEDVSTSARFARETSVELAYLEMQCVRSILVRYPESLASTPQELGPKIHVAANDIFISGAIYTLQAWDCA